MTYCSNAKISFYHLEIHLNISLQDVCNINSAKLYGCKGRAFTTALRALKILYIVCDKKKFFIIFTTLKLVC